MDKTKLLVLITAVAGISVSATTAVFKTASTEPESITYAHAVRIDKPAAGPEVITAWRTKVSPEVDGGVDMVDLGAFACQADSAKVLAWATACKGGLDAGAGKPLSLFDMKGPYAFELRPAKAGSVAVDVYGANGFAKCVLVKTDEVTAFLEALRCTQAKARSGAQPL